MTRNEFAKYCLTGAQWTRETIAAVRMAQAGFLPKCTADEFERELNRPDGFIEIERMPPLFSWRQSYLNEAARR